MSEIIIGIDDSARSEDAVAFARRIADATAAAVTLVNCFPYEDERSRASNEAFREALRDDSQQTLNHMRALLSDQTRVTTRAIADTSPPHALHALAEADEAALIVVGSSHHGRLGQVVPGSTAERLLHGSPCPVAVVPYGYASADHPPIRTIGVAHDGSEEAEAALNGAVEVAQRLGARLRVIRVYDSSVVSPAYLDAPGYIRAQENLERMARERLAETLDRVPESAHPEGVFRSGAAAAVLASLSRELDLLILGSRGYGPLRAVLLGGVSHKVMREARCPVIVLPRGERFGLGALFMEAKEVQAS